LAVGQDTADCWARNGAGCWARARCWLLGQGTVLRCGWLWACVALVSQLWRTVRRVIGRGVGFGAAVALVGGVAALGFVRQQRGFDVVAERGLVRSRRCFDAVAALF